MPAVVSEPPGGLEREVAVGDARRQVLGRVRDRLGAGAADRRGDGRGIPFGPRRRRLAVDVRGIGARLERGRGASVTVPTSTCARRASAGSEPRNPRAASGASWAVSSTTSDGRDVSARTCANAASQSVSISCGSTGAIASTSAGRSAGPSTRVTRARITRSNMRRCVWSPARDASAASSSAASIAASSRTPSPTRAAAVRPVSITMTTCRSRSGRHVRSIVVLDRAVARQSIERTSSPRTYSRRLSNSVP